MPDECPICRRQDGTHATVFHVWMPQIEQERRRWLSEREAEGSGIGSPSLCRVEDVPTQGGVSARSHSRR
jgi:hypothetical protein